jgi:integrase
VSETHTLMDGRLHVYRRQRSRFWQCATYLDGHNYRRTTKQSSATLAIDFAHEWFLDRLAEKRLGLLKGVTAPVAGTPQAAASAQDTAPVARAQPGEKTFRDAATAFVQEYTALTEGERNREYMRSKERIIRLRLLPFFGDLPLSQVTAGRIRDYRVHRMTPPPECAPKPPRKSIFGRMLHTRSKPFKKPSRSTVHQEIVCLRQVLKTAARNDWISALPDMSAPYKSSGKISHRAWFAPEELAKFVAAAADRAQNPRNERWRGESEHFHDYVLFMVNTGLRPDEASRLEFRDITIVKDEDTGERILEIEVRGKRGVGYCKSLPEAVEPFQRVKRRKRRQPTDLVFGAVQRELMNAVLDELGLKKDRDGNPRTAYSLRHTYICLRLMEGADIYQVAKNCRTSVEMIEKFYAAHLKNVIDASAINVRKENAAPPAPSRGRKPRRVAEAT